MITFAPTMRRLVVLDCCHRNLYSRVDHLMIWVCSKLSPVGPWTEFRIIFFPSWGLLYYTTTTTSKKLLDSDLMYLFSDWLWPANSNKSHGLQPCPGWVENFMKGRTVMGVLTLGDKHGHRRLVELVLANSGGFFRWRVCTLKISSIIKWCYIYILIWNMFLM